jgi:PAS domain S-box-containing protein
MDTHVKVSGVRQQAMAAVHESDNQFRMFADVAPAMLWTAESYGSCSFVSRGWYDYTGQSDGAALGFGWLEAVHPDDREETRRIVREATEKHEGFSLDFRVRRADGEFRWALSSGRPRFNSEGAFEGYIGSVIDIHEHKQAAQASALLSAIVDSSDDAIISKDLNGVIMSWNKGAERLFGYTAAEAVAQPITIIIPPDRLDEEPRILERLRRGERVEHFETIRVRKDGSILNISLTISPVKDAEGKTIGASKIARDITERVRQGEALQEANAALQRANADLQQFAYSASHDLQEPLRMVAAYSELLQKRFGDQLGSTGGEYLRYAVEGARRMLELLRDLRTYTQVSTAEQEPAEEIEAGEVLKKTLFNLEAAIKDSGAGITRIALPRVRMHEFELEQIFQNLIGNAIRYRGDLQPRIHVAARLQNKEWVFSVEDNGIGIEPQFKEQVFGVFKRLHTSNEYPGTGLGLAICQRIVQRSGGRIWVDSEPGRGSTFYFTVPCEGTGASGGASGAQERRAAG